MKAFLSVTILLIATYLSIAQAPKSRKLAKIAEEHKTWERCWVVMPNGDTVYGRLKGEFHRERLTAIVKEFNQCIANNLVKQPTK